MKSRSNRSAAQPTTPALVSNATPEGDAPAQGGVLPADAPTTPAVSSTEPLPSDQATAPKVSVPQADATAIDAALTGERPSIVPETPPAEKLVAPVDPIDTLRGGVVREHVSSEVPLPADQITPVLPTERPASLRAALAAMSDDDRAALREVLLGANAAQVEPFTGAPVGDEAFAGVRLFVVAYDVDHDGRSYEPGDPIELTFVEHQRFVRASAVTTDWLRGTVLEA